LGLHEQLANERRWVIRMTTVLDEGSFGMAPVRILVEEREHVARETDFGHLQGENTRSRALAG
jgi:hypothetical protein